MRVSAVAIGIQEHFGNVFAIHAHDLVAIVYVALPELFNDNAVFAAGQLQAQIVVLDTLAPQVIDLIIGSCPFGLFAIQIEGLFDIKIKGLVQQGQGVIEALLDPVPIFFKHREGRRQATGHEH